MTKKLTDTRFFMNTEVLDWLCGKYGNSAEDLIGSGIHGDFAFDMIDRPFHCSAISGDDVFEVKVYLQSETGFDADEPSMTVRFDRQKHTVEFVGDTENNEGEDDLFLLNAARLSRYFAENSLPEELLNMDARSEGVLITLNRDGLDFQKVSRENRPDLTCIDPYDNTHPGRPYPDEIPESPQPAWDIME